MTLTDGRRNVTDLGPCSTEGGHRHRTSVTLPTGYHEEPGPALHCVVCGKLKLPGRYTCSPACHRLWLGRMSG